MSEKNTAMDGFSVGLVDLGTNSVRLLIVRINDNGSFNVLFRHKAMVRLGEGEYLSGRLTAEAMDRTLAALALIAGLCRDFGVTDIIAVATAATRDAENARDFVGRVKTETGIDLRIIPGKEEARLIYTGVASGIPIGERNALFIDIGGGSTEIALGTASEYSFLESLNCGCVRYSNRFFTPGDTGPVPAKVYKRICDQVRKNALRTLNALRNQEVDLAVGSSGTIENLAEIALRRNFPGRRMTSLPPEERKLRYDDLAAVAKRLCALSLEKRRQIPGMNPRRADVIVAGAAIIQTLMQELGLKEILISDRGLQHGLLLDFLRTSRRGFPDEKMTVRELSVLQLAKLFNVQDKHSRHVAHLALEIFDSALVLELFRAEPVERELLRYTALLHDIGMVLSMKNHHAHSRYFIRNAEMLGFFVREIEIMANGAYYHGKKSLGGKNISEKNNLLETEHSTPDPSLQTIALRNGAIIRFCESLDRSHRSLIFHVKLSKGKKEYKLVMEGEDKTACAVEIAAANEALPLLNTIFGKDFSLKFHKPTINRRKKSLSDDR